MLHDGNLFEIGSDGYGYIVDQTEPGQSYPINLTKIKGIPSSVLDMEGWPVTFQIENQRVEKVMLAAKSPAPMARTAEAS